MLRAERGGYLTVFLAMVMTVMLSLVFTVIRGAQVSAVRLRAETVTDIALNSVLGEFSRALLEQYDLFFADASYGSGSPSVQRVGDRIRMYAEKNLTPAAGIYPGLRDFQALSLDSCAVTSARFAADGGAKALKEQIYAYMTADPAGSLAGELLSVIDGAGSSPLQEEDTWSDAWESNMAAFKGAAISEEGEAEMMAVQGETLSSLDTLNAFRASPILWQVLGPFAEVSGASAEPDTISRREIHYGQNTVMESSHGYPEADALLMDLYIHEKCGSYAEPLDKGVLQYQMEYIVFGKDSDRDCLEAMARRLLIIRCAANTAYIYTDSGKTALADGIGAAVAFVTTMPELQPVIKNLILLGWAYVESIQDVRTLFEGGKVPVFKTESTWKTSLWNILVPEIRNTASAESGLTYSNYLQIFLFIMNDRERCLRLMDIMEMDVRQETGDPGFRMDWCLDTLTLEAEYCSRFGGDVRISRIAGYN